MRLALPTAAVQPAESAHAIVVLHEGRLLSWKVNARSAPHPYDLRNDYFRPFDPASPGIATESQSFYGSRAWDDAEEWAASFPVHPEARGRLPRKET